MSEHRVDKSWQEKGLDTYSTEAVLGTLNHYGVTVDEAAFRALAADKYPMLIARGWFVSWKGKGQFSHFPASAAGLLWARLLPEVLAPQTFALAWTSLLHRLSQEPTAAVVPELFEAAEKVAAQLPPEGPRRDQFMSEGLAMVDAVRIDIGQLVEVLGTQKSAHLARLLPLADAFFPEMKGLLALRARAGQGDRAGALAEIGRWATDSARPFEVRATAVEELTHMGASSEALAAVGSMQQEAIKNRDADQLAQLHDLMHGLLHVLPQGPLRSQAMAMVGQQHELLEKLGAQVHH